MIEIAILVTAFYFGTQIIDAEKKDTIAKFSNRVTLLVKNTETQLDSAINLIEVTRNLPIVKNINYSSYISE